MRELSENARDFALSAYNCLSLTLKSRKNMIKYREITAITHVTDTISIYLQELISRLDSRTLPLEPRHRCTSSVLSTCLRNDVLASCLLTKHTPDDVMT